ncbi:MAG: SH3 domain-containing protein [Marinoscillum sp.]
MDYFFNRFIFTVIFSGFTAILALGQNAELLVADSLFSNQKYTEAFEKYENIFQDNQASPAMLTRMAFIQEGLGNYTDALYYLNLYYLKTSDKASLAKMREIAEEHNLVGYEYSDVRFFENYTRKYQVEITLLLLAFSAFLLFYSYRKFKKEEKPVTATILQVVTLIVILITNNNLVTKESAIVRQDQAIIMSGPSAGSEPIDYVGKGNKVTVKESDDLWTQIEWQGAEAYIRNKNIRKL